jgi:NAD-dependent DNA ligase
VPAAGGARAEGEAQTPIQRFAKPLGAAFARARAIVWTQLEEREREGNAMDDNLINQLGSDRIASRQIDELIGIARGLVADDHLHEKEAAFLQKWLAANLHITDQPVIRTLYQRIKEMLKDGTLDQDEQAELLDTLKIFSNQDIELGEVLKATSLPLDDPEPPLSFAGQRYCFTGTFAFGQRKECEQAVAEMGAEVGSLTQKTNVLVIGIYATESWKHSSFGNKIIKACEWRDAGRPIVLVSEPHWKGCLSSASSLGNSSPSPQ